jgi:hypothetical protein
MKFFGVMIMKFKFSFNSELFVLSCAIQRKKRSFKLQQMNQGKERFN